METSPEKREFRIQDYLNIVSRRKGILIAFLFVCVSVAALYAYSTVPVYQSTAKLLIERHAPKPISIDGLQDADSDNVGFYKTQYILLESRSLIKSVIQKLGLESNAEFLGQSGSGKGNPTMTSGGGGNPSFMSSEGGIDPYTHLIDRFNRSLSISPIHKTHIVNVNFQGTSPALSSKIVNTLIETFVQQNIEWQSTLKGNAGDWLEKKVAVMGEEVKALELDLLRFKNANGIIDTAGKREAESQKLHEMTKAITRARTERARLEVLQYQVKKMLRHPVNMLMSLPDSVKNASTLALRNEYLGLNKQWEEQSRHMRPRHPDMLALSRKIKVLQARIPKEMAHQVRSVELDYQAALDREKKLVKTYEAQKKNVVSFDGKAVQYRELKKKLELEKKLFEFYLNRQKELNISSSFKGTNIRIVDRAEVPTKPIRPRKAKIIGLAAIFGIFGGLMLVIYRESLDKTIKSIEDVESHFSIPVLGGIGCFKKNGAHIPIISNKQPHRLEEFRMLREKIFLNASNGSSSAKKLWMVTSATPGEGKTTVVSNLAVSLSQVGIRVGIVDADFRKPKVHDAFNKGLDPGLVEVLLGHKKLAEVMRDTRFKNLKIITAGDSSLISSSYWDHFLFKNVHAFLAELKDRDLFDVILVNAPPVLSISDATIIEKKCDGVLFVLQSGINEKAMVSRAIRQLSPDKVDTFTVANGEGNGHAIAGNHSKIIGIVLNRMDETYENHYYGKYQKVYGG